MSNKKDLIIKKIIKIKYHNNLIAIKVNKISINFYKIF